MNEDSTTKRTPADVVAAIASGSSEVVTGGPRPRRPATRPSSPKTGIAIWHGGARLAFALVPTAIVLLAGPVDVRAQVVNGNFETGDYTGWSVVSGTAWRTAPTDQRGHPNIAAWEGRYYANSYLGGESAVGVLRSSPFTLRAPVTLLLAGYDAAHNYVALKRASDGAELDRVPAPDSDQLRSFSDTAGSHVLTSPAAIGEQVYIEVVDGSSASSFAWLAVDLFVVPGTSVPDAYRSDSWVATDALGRSLPTYTDVGPPRDRAVGIFYFIWHDECGTMGPYDISAIQEDHPYSPPLDDYLDELEEHYGPFTQGHHWGEPLFDYYLPHDDYVLRKHVQMLADAGVDVLIIDNTNAVPYTSNLLRLLSICQQVRNEGNRSPRVAIFAHPHIVQHDYDIIYEPGLFPDVWFRWQGKPLLLTRGDVDWTFPAKIQDFFTIRYSWAFSSWPWFEDGHHKWPWIDEYPQDYGWDTNPNAPEAMAVAVAQHPYLNVGRSYQNGSQPPYGEGNPHIGLHLTEQASQVLGVDPEFAFFTGWNEWIAGRWEIGSPGWPSTHPFLGIVRQAGDSVFIDSYNHEFSRDAEPVKNGYTDNYYYQMIEFIRRFKGVSAPPVPTPPSNIVVDGSFGEWDSIGPEYRDSVGDEPRRNDHPGYAWEGSYINLSGRNDIVAARITYDACNVYFYVRTRDPISPHSDTDWMVLYLDTDSNGSTGWEGYEFIVNHSGVTETTTTLEANIGGRWDWSPVETVDYHRTLNELELSIPREVIDQSSLPVALDFKWADNSKPEGDILRFTTHGDCAPNDRFKYRYSNPAPGGPCGCESVTADLWIDLSNTTVAEGVDRVPVEGTLGIMPGVTDEALTIHKALTIVTCEGGVTIGQQ